jgi:hypothetical protein
MAWVGGVGGEWQQAVAVSSGGGSGSSGEVVVAARWSTGINRGTGKKQPSVAALVSKSIIHCSLHQAATHLT